MGQFKNIFNDLAGVDIYPVISMMVFVIFFLAVGLYAIRANKSHIERMKQLPLQDTPADFDSKMPN